MNKNNLSTLQEKDLKYIFHPCSQMKDYEKYPPIVIERAEGIYVYDEFGRKYMDCVGSWWVNPLGHCNKRINEAIKNQCDTLEHIIFADFSHKPAIELAEKLIDIVPKGLTKLFFADNGSSGVEVALKLSFQSQQQRGFTKKRRFAAIKNSYHGETIGALSVGDIDFFTKTYKPLINDGLKIQGPDCFNCPFKKDYKTCSAECFCYMEKAVKENHEILAGIIIEPMVQGAGGMKIYSPVYLKKLREITKKYNIHLIADEIAVGFGRTGKMFACEHAEISPDIMCIGKALTAGYYPMSIVLMTEEIYNSFYADYFEGKSFLHSHSFSGNPIGCRIALEVLKIYEENNILEEINKKGEYLEKRAREIFKDKKYIGEIRRIGLIGAMEIVKNKITKERFNPKKRTGYNIYKTALKHGAILRPLGDTIYFMPPFVISYEEIDKMLEICRLSIEEYLNGEQGEKNE